MPKTQKRALIAPKNIQLTLITTAAILFVLNAIHWIELFARVYPNGARLSQFTVMAFGNILLPAVFFAIAFFIYKKSATRFDHVFNAAILTVVGLSIHQFVSIIERLLYRYQDISSSLVSLTWMPAISIVTSLCLFIGLLVFLSRRNKRINHSRRLQITAIIFITLAFIVDAAFNIGGLISQNVGSKSILELLTHPMLVMPIILPLAFFITAYITIQKTSGRVPHLFITMLYTLAGVMTAWIASTLFIFGLRTLSLDAYELQTTFVTIVSLAVYAFLLVTHNQSKKVSRKAK